MDSIFSYRCAKTGVFIPGSRTDEFNDLHSRVVQVLPNDVRLTGPYDGYGRVGGKDIYEAIMEAKGIEKNPREAFLNNEKDTGFNDESNARNWIKMVRFDYYDNESFDDLDPSLDDNYAGSSVRYPDRIKSEIKESTSHLEKEQLAHTIVYGWLLKTIDVNPDRFAHTLNAQHHHSPQASNRYLIPQEQFEQSSFVQQGQSFLLESSGSIDDLLYPRKTLSTLLGSFNLRLTRSESNEEYSLISANPESSLQNSEDSFGRDG